MYRPPLQLARARYPGMILYARITLATAAAAATAAATLPYHTARETLRSRKRTDAYSYASSA